MVCPDYCIIYITIYIFIIYNIVVEAARWRLQQAIMQHYNSSAAAVVVVGEEWGSHKEKEGRIHSPFLFTFFFSVDQLYP
mmetsp:Transcript_4221/g.6166  ORF Transcript_4221/g.6166 Transcript_4221/m.6166 type:complete len:80 (+) Transcript_4221:456-695(+)